MKTLEQIIEEEKKTRHENGIYGITACKKDIKSDYKIDMIYGKIKETFRTYLFNKLEMYYIRATNDKFFNKAMILACWEMINSTESI